MKQVDKVKELRLKIDGLIQLVSTLSPYSKPILIIQPPENTNMMRFEELKEELDKWNKNPVSTIISKQFEYEIHHLKVNKEFSECDSSLKMAKGWLGQLLGSLGEKTPYPDTKELLNSADQVQPPADVSTGKELFKDEFELLWWSQELNHIEKIDWLRKQIKTVHFEVDCLKLIDRTFLVNCLNHLTEARMWLGFELARIKQEYGK